MKKEQNLRIKIAKIALNLLVQWFESLTTLKNTHWHLFNFNLIFWIKKPRLLMESGFIRPASIKVRKGGSSDLNRCHPFYLLLFFRSAIGKYVIRRFVHPYGTSVKGNLSVTYCLSPYGSNVLAG